MPLHRPTPIRCFGRLASIDLSHTVHKRLRSPRSSIDGSAIRVNNVTRELSVSLTEIMQLQYVDSLASTLGEIVTRRWK